MIPLTSQWKTDMVLEHADIRIKPGTNREFEAAIERGVTTVIAKAPGFLGYQVQKGVESPDRYLLLIKWASVEDHNVGFRGSPAFQDWRAIVGPFFASPPEVEHFELLVGSF
jgi:heme-degrading monooxygenase HmoA